MKQKNELKTIRFRSDEAKRIEAYLNQNPVFESFSSLGRVATLSFIGQAAHLNLKPISKEIGKQCPSFLWDYDLNEFQVQEILGRSGLHAKKKWLMERILNQAPFNEIMKYLSLEEIQRWFPDLKLPKKIRARWEHALKRWSQHG